MLDVNFTQWASGEDLPVAYLDGQLGGLSQPFEWPIPRKRRQ
jgi:hypothetical protein